MTDTPDIQGLSEQPFLETCGLEMVYGSGDTRVRALQSVDLRVPRGQLLCIRGRSGSGKSTLLHLIAGLRQPSSGTVRVGDLDVHTLTMRQSALYRRRVCGMVFQFFNLLPMLSVAENVAFPLSLDGTPEADWLPRVEALLAELDLVGRRDQHPDQLSGGEMQRVAIARALVTGPDLILADEPTGNLDTAAAHQVWSTMREQAHKRHVTTIMVTHDPDATGWADRVIVLEDGRVTEDSGDLSKHEAAT